MVEHQAEFTFRKYKSIDAQKYGQIRSSYSAALYNHVLARHAATSGNFGRLVDIGCGPGNATRDMALAFDEAVGIDPSEAMIQAANELGGKTKLGAEIQYEVRAAEECGATHGVEEDSVDMVICAMAAHWFDMAKFWDQVGRILKPGGTVTLWTRASHYIHPATPNAEEINRALLHLERDVLDPFETPGNRLSRDMYDNLQLPWDVQPDQTAFPKKQFVKDEWDRDGILTDGEDFFGGSSERSLEWMEKALDTASMVTRWREAHPELAGTDEDCVKQLVTTLRPILNGRGLRASGSTVILFFQKASQSSV